MKPSYVITAGIGLVVLGFVLRHLLDRRNPADRALSELILEAFGADWSGRLELSATDLKSAVRARSATPATTSIADLVERVDIEFARASSTMRVPTTLDCRYTRSRGNAVATMSVPWERLPSDVRGEFLRTGAPRITRHWEAMVERE